MSANPEPEGVIPFPYQGETFQTYYKVFGSLQTRTRPPVVVIHGGPALSHDYLLPLADLTEQSFPVILYDQLGNARSTHLPDKELTFWTIDLFLDELDNLLTHFGIQDAYHIVGHSWGGMMAAEFAVRRQPTGLQRLVIADAPAEALMWGKSFTELLEKFPQPVKDAISKGFEDREGYWKALLEIYAVHSCRVKPFPKELEYSLLQVYGEDADRTVDKAPMLHGWTIIDRLHLIKVPTLVINGRYDIAQDWVIKPFAYNIPNSTWITFEASSHTPFWEERERFMQVVGEFLQN
ncbi:proline-specific peptidase [Trametes versicolor FP-101664 SS1]|uniref:proline-specific peptidase n=1 Tax=Trametes versicolor (strain FP-101664) TaxID=717944 RepID=UPI000462376B|nr:proline-specific peptidase [Trametes versicolor FP-101664 SS1]EIW57647.1 proline-specific peptidase [Trametes versicolor FP-101664 SS1]